VKSKRVRNLVDKPHYVPYKGKSWQLLNISSKKPSKTVHDYWKKKGYVVTSVKRKTFGRLGLGKLNKRSKPVYEWLIRKR